MGLLLEIIKYKRPNDYPLPYFDDLCRMNLYNSLLSTVISPHPQCITQTSVALRLFTLGTMDRNEKVSLFYYVYSYCFLNKNVLCCITK